MKDLIKHIGLLFILALAVTACKKDEPVNPFDDENLQAPEDTGSTNELDPNSFAGLHYNIFKPTCANSGCHDGTFEPDFRTIESAYNTLVWHPIIKNSPDSAFTYRVVPGNVNQSILYHRLTVDIDGISGIMPLSVDPGSDWNEKEQQYLTNIQAWIQNGAKDMFGNPPVIGNKTPQFTGVNFFPTGNTSSPYGFDNGNFTIPASAGSVDLYIGFSDDSTAAQSLTYNKLKVSESVFNFDTVPELDMTIVSPVTASGFFGDPVEHTHKVTLNMNEYNVGQQYFMRVYVQDPQHDVVEIPQDGSLHHIRNYFSFRRVN